MKADLNQIEIDPEKVKRMVSYCNQKLQNSN